MYEMPSDPQYKDELGKQEIDRQHHTIPNQRSQRPMLMYGKEASNRKQEIDCQYHTIPNQRPKDKHYGNVHNRLFRHG